MISTEPDPHLDLNRRRIIPSRQTSVEKQLFFRQTMDSMDFMESIHCMRKADNHAQGWLPQISRSRFSPSAGLSITGIVVRPNTTHIMRKCFLVRQRAHWTTHHDMLWTSTLENWNGSHHDSSIPYAPFHIKNFANHFGALTRPPMKHCQLWRAATDSSSGWSCLMFLCGTQSILM